MGREPLEGTDAVPAARAWSTGTFRSYASSSLVGRTWSNACSGMLCPGSTDSHRRWMVPVSCTNHALGMAICFR